jgi:cob(I)alamin adenosyltransferase
MMNPAAESPSAIDESGPVERGNGVENFVFSKKGDKGQTSLLSGERVSKASLRPEAYGTLDEASSALGLAKVLTQNETITRMIGVIQEDLLVLGAELSCEGAPAGPDHSIGDDRISRLEEWIQELQKEVPMPRRFILPGENPPSAVIDLSRTIVRRAERRVAAIREAGIPVRSQVQAYLNRLADFLFTLARYAGRKA